MQDHEMDGVCGDVVKTFLADLGFKPESKGKGKKQLASLGRWVEKNPEPLLAGHVLHRRAGPLKYSMRGESAVRTRDGKEHPSHEADVTGCFEDDGKVMIPAYGNSDGEKGNFSGLSLFVAFPGLVAEAHRRTKEKFPNAACRNHDSPIDDTIGLIVDRAMACPGNFYALHVTAYPLMDVSLDFMDNLCQKWEVCLEANGEVPLKDIDAGSLQVVRKHGFFPAVFHLLSAVIRRASSAEKCFEAALVRALAIKWAEAKMAEAKDPEMEFAEEMIYEFGGRWMWTLLKEGMELVILHEMATFRCFYLAEELLSYPPQSVAGIASVTPINPSSQLSATEEKKVIELTPSQMEQTFGEYDFESSGMELAQGSLLVKIFGLRSQEDVDAARALLSQKQFRQTCADLQGIEKDLVEEFVIVTTPFDRHLGHAPQGWRKKPERVFVSLIGPIDFKQQLVSISISLEHAIFFLARDYECPSSVRFWRCDRKNPLDISRLGLVEGDRTRAFETFMGQLHKDLRVLGGELTCQNDGNFFFIFSVDREFHEAASSMVACHLQRVYASGGGCGPQIKSDIFL